MNSMRLNVAVNISIFRTICTAGWLLQDQQWFDRSGDKMDPTRHHFLGYTLRERVV